MATTFDQHYLQPVLAQQQNQGVGTPPHQRYQAESQQPQQHNANGNGYTLPTMSLSTSTPTTSQPSNARVEADMADEAGGLTSQNASPAKAGRGGRSKGRGGRPPAKSKAKAPKITKAAANAKQGPGRGRRQKLYDEPKAQAAHERSAEVKSSFNQLARAMKAGLSELAERSLAKLRKDPHAHEKVPEAQQVNSFLDQRLEDTIHVADTELEMRVSNANKMLVANTAIAQKACEDKILEAECDMLDSLLAQTERLVFLRDNKLPVDLSDTSYQYKEITQQQVDQQGPYIHHDERGVPVPCSERVTTLSSLMNEDYLFRDEHRPKRKADGEPEGQPGAKRLGLLGLEDDVPRRTSALMSAHDEVGERSATPGEDQQEPTRKPTKAARGKASAKQTWTTANGTIVDEKDEELLDVEEVNGLPLPKGASLPDEYGVRIITKSRKAEYANNRIMAPVASPFEDWQIGYRDSSNSSLKGANKARRRGYLGGPNSNAAFYDRRVANYNSVLQREDDYDQELVKKHNLHPTLGLFLPNSVNEREYPVKKDLQQYNPIVQVGPKGQIFHASRSVPRNRLDQEVKKRHLKSAVSAFIAEEAIAEDEVAPSKEVQEQHREAMLWSRAIDPAKLPVPGQESSPLASPRLSLSPSQLEAVDEVAVAEEAYRSIEELLHAADQVESEENVAKMASVTAAHKSSRPYDAIRDVFTENTPAAAPVSESSVPIIEGAQNDVSTFNLSFLADVAMDHSVMQRVEHKAEKEGGRRIAAERQETERTEAQRIEAQRVEAERAEFERQEHHRRELERMDAQRVEYGAPPTHGPSPVEVSVMDPRLFPHDGPQGTIQVASPEAHQSQYPDPPQLNQYHHYEPPPQWQREEPPVQPTEPPRGHDFMRTALNPQTPPPPQPNYAPYPPPLNYPGQAINQGPPTQVPQPQGNIFINSGPQRGSLPALRPVRTSFDDGTPPPEYQESPTQSHRPSLVASNSGSFYPPPPPRPYHNGYMIDEPQNMHPQQSSVGPHPPHYPQPYPPPHHPGYPPNQYPPPPPEAGYYGYQPIAPVPGGPVYHPAAPYNPMAQHPGMAPMPRGQPGNSNRPYRKLEPAPPQQPKPRGARAQRPELRTVPFDYGSIKDYVPVEAPPSHGPPSKEGTRDTVRGSAAAEAATSPPPSTSTNPARTFPTTTVLPKPEGTKKRKRGLREAILSSPAAAQAAVNSDTPVARRTRAGRAAAASGPAARAAAAAAVATAPGPPPAPMKPTTTDNAEEQEPPRKKSKNSEKPEKAKKEKKKDSFPSADVWRVAGPDNVVRMRVHPRKYFERKLEEKVAARKKGRAPPGRRVGGGGASLAPPSPRVTRSSRAKAEAEAAAAAAASAAAPAAAPAAPAPAAPAPAAPAPAAPAPAAPAPAAPAEEAKVTKEVKEDRKEVKKKKQKGKERAASASAAPAPVVPEEEVVAGPSVAARGPRGGEGRGYEGVRYGGYEWERVRVGRKWVWEGR